MTPRNDQVFQLSLTEIAFTIAFILLLLLGYRVWQEQAARDAARAALAQAQEAQRTTGSLQRAHEELAQALRTAGSADPDAAISKLVEVGDLRAERDRLRQQVDDLDARLSALAPVSPGASAPLARASAAAALGMEASGATRATHDASRGGKAEDASRIEKENADLRGQVAFLSNRLGAATGHGGRDFPPCWADESGRVEFLFAIETRPGEVVVAPAWPARREREAQALPGVSSLLGAPLANADFIRAVQTVFDWSRAQNPECRHFVELRSTIADAVQSDRARLMVERYFYKSEVPR